MLLLLLKFIGLVEMPCFIETKTKSNTYAIHIFEAKVVDYYIIWFWFRFGTGEHKIANERMQIVKKMLVARHGGHADSFSR